MPFTQALMERALCEGSLREFIKYAWPIVDPADFEDSWHIQAIAEHLEAVTKGQIRNLIINVPPRYGKSNAVAVMWPAWEWGPAGKPGTKFMFISHSENYSVRDSVKMRSIVTHPAYQKHWGSRVRITADQNQKARFHNTQGGFRIALSVGGASTGEGADRIGIDDPNNVKNIHSPAERKMVIRWFSEVMTTRRNDPRTSGFVLIMQRCHSEDLVGYLKEHAASRYEMLIMPQEFEPSTRCRTSIGFKDPRLKDGELLWPSRFGPAEVEDIKADLGSHAYAAQCQQRPSLLEGSIFKREWWRFYETMPVLDTFSEIIQSWDMAFKDLKTSDYVVGQVWGFVGPDRYLLDETRGRLSFTATVTAVRNLSAKWPTAQRKLVEDKANGTAVIDSLKRDISGLRPWNPEGSKESRAFAVTPECESGHVYLPSMTLPWVGEYIEELSAFPTGAHDDRVDATTQALIYRQQELAKKNQGIAPVVSIVKTGPGFGYIDTTGRR